MSGVRDKAFALLVKKSEVKGYITFEDISDIASVCNLEIQDVDRLSSDLLDYGIILQEKGNLEKAEESSFLYFDDNLIYCKITEKLLSCQIFDIHFKNLPKEMVVHMLGFCNGMLSVCFCNVLIYSVLQNGPFRIVKRPESQREMGRIAIRNGPFCKTRRTGLHCGITVLRPCAWPQHVPACP